MPGTLPAGTDNPAGLAFRAEDVQGVLEIGRVLAAELSPVTVRRMGEAEADRVQPLPGQPEPVREHRVRTVQPVADAWVAQRRHVHPYLVRAPGLQDDLSQAGAAE